MKKKNNVSAVSLDTISILKINASSARRVVNSAVKKAALYANKGSGSNMKTQPALNARAINVPNAKLQKTLVILVKMDTSIMHHHQYRMTFFLSQLYALDVTKQCKDAKHVIRLKTAFSVSPA